MTEPRLRPAVRALVIDPEARILLVRFEFEDVGTVWAMPGGGIEPHETAMEALHRELSEEVGLHDAEIGPLIWDFARHRIGAMGPDWDGQRDRVHLIRVPVAFEPAPMMTWDQLRSEGLHEVRWWTAAEVAAHPGLFAPRRLPRLLDDLLRNGHPAEPTVFVET